MTQRPPEDEILLCCARRRLGPDDDARLAAALSRAVEWDRLLALAARNGLVPLLALHLAPTDVVPGDVSNRLKAEAADDRRRALRLAGELVRLLEAFRAAGVRACAYKGPALAVRAYGDLGLRRFSDLDVLVHPEDADGAVRILDERGYRPRFRFTPAQDRLFRRTDGDYPFRHSETEILVELHTRVSPSRFVADLPTDALLARARRLRVGGGEVPALADDDLFLALAVHGAKHRWERLEWLAAVAELLRGDGIGLAPLLQRAGTIHARRTVLLALLLAHDLLGAPVPSGVIGEARADAGLRALANEAVGRIFRAPSEDDADEETTAANLRFNLRARDGAADRARYALRWLFVPSPEDWAWARLPDALFPLYRAVRPLRLALRYGRRR